MRTKDGIIGKIFEEDDIEKNGVYTDTNYINEYCDETNYIKRDNIAKHSKNIIDLIEDGDYLNGYLVRKINGELCNFDLNTTEWTPLKNIDIFESIVTKQQFENIEYKI